MPISKVGKKNPITRAREGWGKDNISFGGAFRKAKYEIRRRRKSEGAKVRDYEKQIDQLVYLSAKALASADKLYSLTPEEIKIVEQ